MERNNNNNNTTIDSRLDTTQQEESVAVKIAAKNRIIINFELFVSSFCKRKRKHWSTLIGLAAHSLIVISLNHFKKKYVVNGIKSVYTCVDGLVGKIK